MSTRFPFHLTAGKGNIQTPKGDGAGNGGWDRTNTNRVKVCCPTIRLHRYVSRKMRLAPRKDFEPQICCRNEGGKETSFMQRPYFVFLLITYILYHIFFIKSIAELIASLCGNTRYRSYICLAALCYWLSPDSARYVLAEGQRLEL